MKDALFQLMGGLVPCLEFNHSFVGLVLLFLRLGVLLAHFAIVSSKNETL
jgi:hypothetical protein